MSNMTQQTRTQQARETMKRVYRYQAANQTRSVIRRSGKTRLLKTQTGSVVCSGHALPPLGWQPMTPSIWRAS